MARVIAFAGKIGSGKTTVTRSLSDILGWPRVSFGDYVRRAVRGRGLDEERVTLQRVGTELLRADTYGFCRNVLTSSGWKNGENILIDGLRHTETIEVIKELANADRLDIVFLKISEGVRLARLSGREGRDASYRASVEAHSSEDQVTSSIFAKADLIVSNDGPLQDTVSATLNWIQLS